jgi:hypothetical protein
MLLNQPSQIGYLLLPAGGFIVVWLVLYLARFRYTPLLRKIHDLRWEIRIGRNPRRIIVRNLRPRQQILADLFYHAMYPVTGDSRYILSPDPLPIASVPYSWLKDAYRSRLTCHELLAELEWNEPIDKEGM